MVRDGASGNAFVRGSTPTVAADRRGRYGERTIVRSSPMNSGESFDQSLKYLLQHEPAAFIRFGLGDPTVEVIGPLPSGLPSRGRDVDGGYLIARGSVRMVAHVEFHRRHQSLEELAVDVAEAQIRFFRRERLEVRSQVWDLYGTLNEPVLEDRVLRIGGPPKGACSQSVYHLVNLRGLRWEELLSHGPPTLWPLVTLTGDGATEEVVVRARDAIEGRKAWSSAERADHLAVLWFMAEAEDVPTKVMKAYISEGRLMESALYRSIFEKGEARGKTEGKAEAYAQTIIRILTQRMGALDPVTRERIRALSDVETLAAWQEEAILVLDAEAARRLAEKIQKAPLPEIPQRADTP